MAKGLRVCEEAKGHHFEHLLNYNFFLESHQQSTRAIFVTKTKTRTKLIAIRLLKLKLKYSKKLKLYKTILIYG